MQILSCNAHTRRAEPIWAHFWHPYQAVGGVPTVLGGSRTGRAVGDCCVAVARRVALPATVALRRRAW
eukprot:359194-Chlamydomonas_euryale.AAC.5